MPQLEQGGDGRIFARPPARERGWECYYFQFENKNPAALHNFFLIVSMKRNGDFMMVTQVVPLADGGVLRFHRHDEYQRTMSYQTVKTMTSKHQNFGIVSISRMRVREYYRGLRETVFSSGYTLYRCDVNGNREQLPVLSQFPDLPPGDRSMGGGDEDYLYNQLDSAGTPLMHRLCFPEYRQLSDGEYEVNGEASDETWWTEPGGRGVSISAATSGKRRIFNECSLQEGNPTSVIDAWWEIGPDGKPRFLFGDFATGFDRHHYQEIIRVRKKRSWFRKKIKITIIRQEHRVQGIIYKEV